MKSFLTVMAFILLLGEGCKMSYSFTGAALPPEVKTLSIDYFPTYAPLATPTISQQFTEALKDKFLSQTSLSLVQNNGDLHFEGEITGYQTSPVAITGAETAAKNRLTITVNVRYTNNFDEDQDFEKKFSQFEDYDNTQSLAQVESQLIEEINEKLVQQIFNESVSNW